MPESNGHTGGLRGLRHGWDRLQSFSVLSGFLAKINWKAKDKGGKFVEKNVFVTNIQVNKWQHAFPLIIIYKSADDNFLNLVYVGTVKHLQIIYIEFRKEL